MWTKVKKWQGRKGGGNARTGFAIKNYASSKTANLVIPHQHNTASRADWFDGGDGLIAILMTDDGEYTVSKINKTTLLRECAIPSQYRHGLPIGTTEITPTREGDMFVFDLDAIRDDVSGQEPDDDIEAAAAAMAEADRMAK